jgi:hypothetical protein
MVASRPLAWDSTHASASSRVVNPYQRDEPTEAANWKVWEVVTGLSIAR